MSGSERDPRRRRRTSGWALLLVVLPLAACGTGEDSAGGPTTTVPATAPAEEWPTCRNPTAGYRIQHPPDWRTNPATVMPPCSLFDPRPIEVAPATEVPLGIAVAVRHEPVPFEKLTEPGAPGEVVLDRRDEVVAGRLAVRFAVEATGDGLAPAGTRSTRWVVRLADGSLVARTTDVGSPAYGRKQGVLDRMVRSLEVA